ncbi:hypothetical protein MUK42_24176 [Musa troglodytarum]|uniref:Uncharacterized protein n=1 Tax=Musa troglodytarum TaxID=320322 RepID=A0A9E7IHG5_9LILI|nr:hypothetical protein MUK42_24176 [Musa troglodytarum]
MDVSVLYCVKCMVLDLSCVQVYVLQFSYENL